MKIKTKKQERTILQKNIKNIISNFCYNNGLVMSQIVCKRCLKEALYSYQIIYITLTYYFIKEEHNATNTV